MVACISPAVSHLPPMQFARYISRYQLRRVCWRLGLTGVLLFVSAFEQPLTQEGHMKLNGYLALHTFVPMILFLTAALLCMLHKTRTRRPFQRAGLAEAPASCSLPPCSLPPCSLLLPCSCRSPARLDHSPPARTPWWAGGHWRLYVLAVGVSAYNSILWSDALIDTSSWSSSRQDYSMMLHVVWLLIAAQFMALSFSLDFVHVFFIVIIQWVSFIIGVTTFQERWFNSFIEKQDSRRQVVRNATRFCPEFYNFTRDVDEADAAGRWTHWALIEGGKSQRLVQPRRLRNPSHPRHPPFRCSLPPYPPCAPCAPSLRPSSVPPSLPPSLLSFHPASGHPARLISTLNAPLASPLPATRRAIRRQRGHSTHTHTRRPSVAP